ncbi:YbjN domain-containing protein [Paraurantiacibacter namhicola]|uniref:Bacterial sensory transduction regulator n=1 Tax=Paraurantiacibacter namhicola TaxID=645517 RepID=A0A1C7D8Z6_9SPHN|nr:YbjN domain-containing protein [Paraurantiacibacter namhicola]ANU07773.1 hypothetical protein A6F65_01469 [Paraurantiacibacter namhicola]
MKSVVAAIAAPMMLGAAQPAFAQDAGTGDVAEAEAEEDFSVPVPETVVQPRLVTAADPDSVRDALLSAGFPATMDTDSVGDPMVRTEMGGYKARIMFYGCDEETNTGCDSLQFVVGLDRESPMPLPILNELSKEWRYISIYLDEEGDPFFNWDIVTGDGLATSIFLDSVRRFSDNVAAAAERVFEEERDSAIDLTPEAGEEPLAALHRSALQGTA